MLIAKMLKVLWLKKWSMISTLMLVKCCVFMSHKYQLITTHSSIAGNHYHFSVQVIVKSFLNVCGHISFSHISTAPDVDECAQEQDNCGSNATCTNTIGSFECQCLPGFTGDGATCEGKLL